MARTRGRWREEEDPAPRGHLSPHRQDPEQRDGDDSRRPELVLLRLNATGQDDAIAAIVAAAVVVTGAVGPRGHVWSVNNVKHPHRPASTISPFLPHKLPLDPISPYVLQILTANADSHLQKNERKKLGRTNKTDPSTPIITHGNTLIGDLLHGNMLLIPFVIDPLGRFGPLLQNFLFRHHPAPQLRFPPSRPNATQMYTKLLQYPIPKGILLLANHNWSLYPTRRFYGHSYLAPTPSITTAQSLGFSLTKKHLPTTFYAS